MSEVPQRPGIRAPIVTPEEVYEDPDKTVEIPVVSPPVRRPSALRRTVDRTSAAIQRHDGRKVLLALSTMVTVMAVAIVFPRAEPLARAICIALTAALALIWLRVIRGSAHEAQLRADALLSKPVSPSRRAQLAMGRKEHLVYERKEHPIVLLPLASAYVIVMGSLLMFAPQWSKLWACILVTLVAGFFYLRWQRRHVCVSTYRVFLLDGIISRDVKEMPLSKMTDRSHNASPLSVVLAKFRIIDRPFGRVEFESAGQDQAVRVIHALPDSEALSRWIVTTLMPADTEGDGT